MMKRTPQGQQHEFDARDGGERGGVHGGNDFTVAHPVGHESWGATGPTAYGYGESVGGPVRGGLHDSARFDAAEGSIAYPEDMLSEDTLEPIDTSALRDEGAARPRTVLPMLAGIGIGAALMYFFDPNQGARRRALVRDQAARLLRTGRREMHVVIEDARNRGTGAVAEVRGRVQEWRQDEPVDDEQLVARVRAELGHHVERARAIEVVAERGRVILRGQVPADDLQAAVRTAQGVRGVTQVESQLQVAASSTNTEAAG